GFSLWHWLVRGARCCLSLHDALPICSAVVGSGTGDAGVVGACAGEGEEPCEASALGDSSAGSVEAGAVVSCSVELSRGADGAEWAPPATSVVSVLVVGAQALSGASSVRAASSSPSRDAARRRPDGRLAWVGPGPLGRNGRTGMAGSFVLGGRGTRTGRRSAPGAPACGVPCRGQE